jgi:hypothetical protein
LKRALALVAVWAVCGPAHASDPPPGVLPSQLSDADKERFLSEGEVVRRKGAKGGVTGSERVTLRWGSLEHDAHVQRIDQEKSQLSIGGHTEIDFRDSYRNNIAAYLLDRRLGLGMVPVTVKRTDRRGASSYTWWVDDVIMDETKRFDEKIHAPDVLVWNRQMFIVRAFDQLIYNFDRNLGNLLIDKDWRLWMIDHTRAFKTFKTLREPKNLTLYCERDLLAALRRLDKPTLEETMKDLLSGGQIDGLLARRDLIVQFYEGQIATRGETAVLYDLPERLKAPSPASP